MANEPVWLTADHLIEFNELEVSVPGEPHVVRDLPGLESALARPINHLHYGEADVVAFAVALLLGVARNHPFLQGNKPTAFAAADYFPYLNAYEFQADQDDEALAEFLIDAINGDVSEHYLIEVLGEWVMPALQGLPPHPTATPPPTIRSNRRRRSAMADRDHNRSNNTGTGAKTLDRDAEPPTPSQSGSSGGDLQREIGALDEEKTATGGDPQPTSVHKSQKPRGGDEPNLPNRDGGGTRDKVPPRRT